MSWKLLETLPGGHRLFTEPSVDRVFIADESGENPDRTDDGLIWLDRQSPIQIGNDGTALVPVIMAPTLHGDRITGKKVLVTTADALALSESFNYELHTTNGAYRAVRVRDWMRG